MRSILRRTTGQIAPGSVPPAEALPGDAPPAVPEGQVRRLADVPWEELCQAVADMCARLNVRGSVDGLYDLYSAVAGEWGKAHKE